jgi:hypothetical protein
MDTSKIEKIINEFLKQFECYCELSNRFAYDDGLNLINYTLFEVQDGTAEEFLDAINKYHHPKVQADIFLWCLLHEIGHHETLCLFNEKEFDEYLEFVTDAEQGKHTNAEYCICPIEWSATDWAVEYANNHFEELSIFWDKLRGAILEFYRDNGLA